MKKKHFVAKLKDIKPREGYCGLLYEVLNEKNARTEGFSIAVVLVNPGEKARTHYHKHTEEAYYVLDGEGIINVEGKKYFVKKDCVVYIPTNNVHRIENSGKKILKILTIDQPPFDPKDSNFTD